MRCLVREFPKTHNRVMKAANHWPPCVCSQPICVLTWTSPRFHILCLYYFRVSHHTLPQTQLSHKWNAAITPALIWQFLPDSKNKKGVKSHKRSRLLQRHSLETVNKVSLCWTDRAKENSLYQPLLLACPSGQYMTLVRHWYQHQLAKNRRPSSHEPVSATLDRSSLPLLQLS